MTKLGGIMRTHRYPQIGCSHPLGKQALGLAVTDLNGNQLTFGAASKRHFGKFISGFLFIGFIMAGFTSKRQGLHDMMAGALVLEKR